MPCGVFPAWIIDQPVENTVLITFPSIQENCMGRRTIHPHLSAYWDVFAETLNEPSFVVQEWRRYDIKMIPKLTQNLGKKSRAITSTHYKIRNTVLRVRVFSVVLLKRRTDCSPAPITFLLRRKIRNFERLSHIDSPSHHGRGEILLTTTPLLQIEALILSSPLFSTRPCSLPTRPTTAPARVDKAPAAFAKVSPLSGLLVEFTSDNAPF